MSAVVDSYDTALFDLDGVVYRGPEAIPGAVPALGELRRRGTKVGYVTNNAARSPKAVAEHLRELGIEATADDVVTSAQAVARLMANALPTGARVLVAGTAALASEIASVGLTPVRDTSTPPDAVVVGFAPTLTWDDLNEAAYAVQQGALWYGCNPDRTRPTDRGLAIGLGTMLDALGEVLPGQEPILAGKPYRPLLDETLHRLGAERPIFVGDRLDTDIEGANNVGIDSLFVLCGSHGPQDLLLAPVAQRPSYVAEDLGGLLLPPVPEDPTLVTVVDGQLRPTRAAQASLEAGSRVPLLWMASKLAWRANDEGRPLDCSPTLDVLSRFGP